MTAHSKTIWQLDPARFTLLCDLSASRGVRRMCAYAATIARC
ncbi:hypothetical protein [Qipengyuania sp. 483]